MPNWLKNAVFYEIYPQSFYDSNNDGIGDINGITEKLDYIKWLGCNAVWINPCFDSPFMDAGYDVRDYKKVAERYGTNEDLYRLFQKAHDKGIKVLLDLVPGHTSEEHEWFKQSCKPSKNEYSNRYVWTDSVWNTPKEFKCISGRSARNGSYIVNFFSTQPALNYGFKNITEDWQLPCDHPDCVATRLAMQDVMRFWLNKGCDGFRVDMAGSLVKNDDPDKSGTGAVWTEIRKMMDKEYPEAALVAEWSRPLLSLKYGFHCDFYLNSDGNGCHALFRERKKNTGKPTSFFSKNGKGDIRRFVDEYQTLYDGSKKYGYISLLTCNHDTPRMSRDYSETELKIAYAFIFTMPGVPFLYYGDEIGMKYMQNLISKEGGYERTGTRTPMQWNSSVNDGFSKASADKLYLPVDKSKDFPNVKEQIDRKNSLINVVKSLIQLRHDYKDLQADGDYHVLYAESHKYPFVYKRGQLVIAVNPSAAEAKAPVAISGKVLFSIGKPINLCEKSIQMPAQSFAVFQKNQNI